MAYAGAEFAKKILLAINGETGITVPTYVNLTSDPAGGDALKKQLGQTVEYFSSVVELGVSPAPSCVGDMIW
jgi:malate dehydrogenase